MQETYNVEENMFLEKWTSSQEYSSMTFAPNHKQTESVSSIHAREYIPSDTSKSAKSDWIVRRIPCENKKKWWRAKESVQKHWFLKTQTKGPVCTRKRIGDLAATYIVFPTDQPCETKSQYPGFKTSSNINIQSPSTSKTVARHWSQPPNQT